MTTTPDNLLFLYSLNDDLHNGLFHHRSKDGGEADRPVDPWVLLLALFEDWSDIGLGTSPVLQDLSEMMESGSAMTSTSSLSTRGCIPPGPMDLWESRLQMMVFASETPAWVGDLSPDLDPVFFLVKKRGMKTPSHLRASSIRPHQPGRDLGTLRAPGAAEQGASSCLALP